MKLFYGADPAAPVQATFSLSPVASTAAQSTWSHTKGWNLLPSAQPYQASAFTAQWLAIKR
jgi:hypothetical protein